MTDKSQPTYLAYRKLINKC